MKVNQLKEIIKLVSLGGLLQDFCIDVDGSVKSIDESNTLLVDLQYNNITLENKVGIDNGIKTLRLLSSFDNDDEITFTDSHIIVKNSNGRNAKIPLINIESIKRTPKITDENPDMIMNNVSLENLKKSASHKISELDAEYLFYLEDNITMLRIGNESCGLITEPLGEMSQINNPGQVSFTMNLLETIKSLEHNPDMFFYNSGFIRFEVITDEYSVKYILAGRIES